MVENPGPDPLWIRWEGEPTIIYCGGDSLELTPGMLVKPEIKDDLLVFSFQEKSLHLPLAAPIPKFIKDAYQKAAKGTLIPVRTRLEVLGWLRLNLPESLPESVVTAVMSPFEVF